MATKEELQARIDAAIAVVADLGGCLRGNFLGYATCQERVKAGPWRLGESCVCCRVRAILEGNLDA
jgi:hypothetical protein